MPPVPKPQSSGSGRNRNLIIALAVAALVAVALIAGSVLLTGGSSDKTSASTETAVATTGTSTPASVALVAGIPQKGTILGSPASTVRMLQFEDLQCPICKQYTDNAFSAIVNEYVRTGRIKIDFRGLAFLGPDSLKALKIAVAAGFQNKLWQVVGLFYDNQGPENSGWVTTSLIDQILSEVPGLDAAKVKKDANSVAVANQIAAFEKQATNLKVHGTPSFFIGVGVNALVPAQPHAYVPSEFRPILDAALRG
jgi:protein-disulfide isomerase